MWVLLALTMGFLGAGWKVWQGRTLHRRVSISSLHAGFWLETRVETPAPQLWEQALHWVLCSTQEEAGENLLL